MNRFRLPLSLTTVLVAAAVGCEKSEQITRYRAEKPHVVFQANHAPSATPRADQAPPPSGPPTDRMLAAYVPHQQQGWFFKLVGPIDAVSAQQQAFRDFLQSVTFGDGDSAKPSWKLPESWTSRSDSSSSMRFATILIDAEPQPLELSVIPLPMPDGATPEYELLNVNRWREQMALAPLNLAEIAEMKMQSEQIDIDGIAVTLVDLKGHFQSGGMSGAPFASGGRMPKGHPEVTSSAAPAGNAPFDAEAPADWKALPASGLRKAAYSVAEGERQAEITVIDLAAAAGELLPNVNRWRGQIGLSPVSQSELEAQLEKLEAGPLTADYIELTSPGDAQPRQTILAAVLVHQDKAWFFKLMGDAELAAREKENFQAFVKSVRFDGQ